MHKLGGEICYGDNCSIQFVLHLCLSRVVDWFRNLLMMVRLNQKEGTDLRTETLIHHYKENKREYIMKLMKN